MKLAALCLFFALVGPVEAIGHLHEVRAQFALADDEVSYEKAKIAIDLAIDPTTDQAHITRQLDMWERALRAHLPPNANMRTTLSIFTKVLYQPDEWNDHRPIAFDLDDPWGRKPRAKSLARLLETRRGHCEIMPVFVAILAQRLGLPVALAVAPRHVMAKFGDAEAGEWINFEATSGGVKSDGAYIREMQISPLALENELYLRPLKPREALVVLAGPMLSSLADRKAFDTLAEFAELLIATHSRSPLAMQWKANAAWHLLQSRYVEHYTRPADIPLVVRGDYYALSGDNLAWGKKLDSLGWEAPTSAQDAEYLEAIEREKARINAGSR